MTRGALECEGLPRGFLWDPWILAVSWGAPSGYFLRRVSKMVGVSGRTLNSGVWETPDTDGKE